MSTRAITPHPRHLTRRALLGGLGAGALLAPFLGREARAAGVPIKNLVVVTWPDGLETGWQPTGSGAAYEFKDVLAPLNPFRDRLLVVNGLKGGTENIILQHSQGTISMWTGTAPRGLDSQARNPSFDQLVAAKLSGSAPYRSLHFGAQTNRASAISSPYVHYAGAKQPIPAEDDPSVMYKLIFGGISRDPAALDRLRAERRSVLDFAAERLRALRGQIGAADRVKLQKHEEGIAAIEKGLATLGAQQCGTAVAAPTMTKQAALADASFPAVIKLQTDLLVTALQCGVTRVATLQMSNTDSQVRIPGIATTRTVHDAMHSGTAPERVAVNRFFGLQLGYVLERLASADVGGGRKLLDDTLVVMSTEMAVGGHWNDPIPFLLAGSGGGRLAMGRYVSVAGRPRHTKLLTTVLRALGHDAQSVGEFTDSDSVGELPQLEG